MNTEVYYILSILLNTHSMWKTISSRVAYVTGIFIFVMSVFIVRLKVFIKINNILFYVH